MVDLFGGFAHRLSFITMGRQSYYTEGTGMTVQEARRNAVQSDLELHGHEEGYSGGIGSSTDEDDRASCLVQPVQPKKALVIRAPRGCPLKWETRYVAETVDPQNGRPVVSEKTMGACIAKAREYCRIHNVRLELRIEKVAVKGSTHFGEVSPQKGTLGRWAFTGTARC